MPDSSNSPTSNPPGESFVRPILVLVLVVLAIRIASAAILNLGIDEVYYWVYSLNLKWTYFDHPPMVGWSIFVTTLGDILHSEFFVRLPALLSWAGSTFLLFYLVKEKWGQTQALFLVAIMSLSIYNSIIAGMMILPDGPLVFFSALFVYAFSKLESEDLRWRWWVILSVSLGLAYWSKYQSFIWAPMLAIWIIAFRRTWLRSPKLYIAAFINVICLLPVLYFNFFDSGDQLGYHGSRFSFSEFRLSGLLRAAVGEILYQHPLVFFTLILAFLEKEKITSLQWFYLMCALPLIGAGWTLSLFESILPHWTGPSYIFLFLFIVSRLDFAKYANWYQWALVIQIALMVIGLMEVRTGIFSNSQAEGKNVYRMGNLDGTLDVYGWQQLSEGLKEYSIQNLVINHWYPGAHLQFYVAEKLDINLIPFGESDMLHEYIHHTNHLDEKLPANCHYIESSRFHRQGKGILEDTYDLIEVGRVPIVRSGDTVMYYFVNKVVACGNRE